MHVSYISLFYTVLFILYYVFRHAPAVYSRKLVHSDLFCCFFRMLLFVCVMLLVASELRFCLDVSLDGQWEQWKKNYSKKYKNDVGGTETQYLKGFLLCGHFKHSNIIINLSSHS